ncbi:hypothetical protein KAW65_00030 [candidate division WOR-3 bacterium]|nr:hypothetical protein [candidate division WOR-3 bacterium]
MAEKANHPKGTARILPLQMEDLKDKGYTKSALHEAAYTWGQGTFFPNNLIKVMAHCPKLAQTEIIYANSFLFDEEVWLNGVQQAGFVNRCLREMVISCISLINRCRYSVTHHSLIGYLEFQKAGRSRQEYIDKYLHLHEFDSSAYKKNYTLLELALFEYAKKICEDPHTVSDKEFEKLQRLFAAYNRKQSKKIISKQNEQLVKSQIVEITWLVCHFCLLNRWFTVLHVEDEGKKDELDFLKIYEETVPEEIIRRNNLLLGDDF